MEKKTIKERFDAFIEELKKDYPEEERKDMVEAFVLVGVTPKSDGQMDCYGYSRGNAMSMCAALTSLFDNKEMLELLSIASSFVVERTKKELFETKK